MQNAVIPQTLPGEFYVLEWNRDAETFIIHLDDEDGSSFDLGGNVRALMMRFNLWGIKAVGDRSIDLAKEFGAATAIWTQNRVTAEFDRAAFMTPELNWDGQRNGNHLPELK